MEYKLNAFSIWETGTKVGTDGMPLQEDSIFPAHGASGATDRLFVLCDGMGGHDSGQLASRLVCDTISGCISREMAAGRQFSEAMFAQALSRAYDVLDSHDTYAERKMGTTLALLMLYDDGYFAAHIGDSRVYHIRPGADAESTQIVFCSQDHSLYNSLRRNGSATAEEIENARHRHVITRAMQPNMEYRQRADIEMSADIQPGDYFFICSHGMLESISDYNLRYIFSHEGGNDRNKQNLLTKVTAANRDNHSAIVVHITDVTPGHYAPEPAQRIAAADTAPTAKPKNTMKIQGDTMQLVKKCLIGLMLLLTLIMIIYYAFIRHDETPPKAGYAVDGVIQEEEYMPQQEEYGYEVTTDNATVEDTDSVAETSDEETTGDQTDINDEGATAGNTEEPAEMPETETPATETPATPSNMPTVLE